MSLSFYGITISHPKTKLQYRNRKTTIHFFALLVFMSEKVVKGDMTKESNYKEARLTRNGPWNLANPFRLNTWEGTSADNATLFIVRQAPFTSTVGFPFILKMLQTHY